VDCQHGTPVTCSTGQLAQVSGSPFSPAGSPVSVAFDADGFLMAIATGKTAVYSYKP